MRALLFGALCEGKTQLRNVLASPDVDAMIRACQQLGAEIGVHEKGSISVLGTGGALRTPDDIIDAGNSGLVLRLVGAVAALGKGYTVITGDDSIRYRRPINPLLSALTNLGAMAVSTRNDGHAPIIIRGPIEPGFTSIESEDSQLLTGLLIAAAFASGQIDIEVTKLGELPFIQLTLDWLNFLGVKFEHRDFNRFSVVGKKTYPAFQYTVPADFSSAAYPIAAALITGSELTLTHLDMKDSQGDKGLVELLRVMGAHIETNQEAQTLTVKKYARLKGCAIDVNPIIDAITILPVIACFAQGETVISNGEIARHKECDRISAIVTELKKMGADIEEKKDGLVVRPSELHGAEIETYQDHRIALSMTVAGLGASGSTVIKDIDCTKKTYPDFFNHLRFLGAEVAVKH